MTLTEKEFKSALSQMRQLSKDDGTFESHTLKTDLAGLTDTWTCKFDDSRLFDEFGLATGTQLHFLSTCNN